MGVAIYERLETFLRGSGHRFLIPEAGQQASWDRALFLNLTYWNVEAAARMLSVICYIPADVVAHVAWVRVGHSIDCPRVAADAAVLPAALASSTPNPIASAFDLYLVGCLLPRAAESRLPRHAGPDDGGVRLQVAGLSEAGFAALLEEVTRARSVRSKHLQSCCSIAAAVAPRRL